MSCKLQFDSNNPNTKELMIKMEKINKFLLDQMNKDEPINLKQLFKSKNESPPYSTIRNMIKVVPGSKPLPKPIYSDSHKTVYHCKQQIPISSDEHNSEEPKFMELDVYPTILHSFDNKN